MGTYHKYQDLTTADAVTVVIYRLGIALAALCIAGLAFFFVTGAGLAGKPPVAEAGVSASGLLLYGLFVSIGLAVFFIHLYVGRFKKILLGLYALAAAAFGALVMRGSGDPVAAVLAGGPGPVLLLPLSLCLGFVTAKEAFCFRLVEGYLLAMLMPIYLVLAGAGAAPSAAGTGLLLIAAMMGLFTVRKTFMPLHCDIGDKSAYQ